MTDFVSILIYLLCFLAVFALTGSLFFVKKESITPKILSQTALVIAMTMILTQIHLFAMPQGGEIQLGSMIPLILLAACYGSRICLMAGLVCGTVAFIMNPYFFHPVQVLLDYPFPYMAMASVALFNNRIILGTMVAYSLKFLFHFTSGVVFFASYAPEGTSPIIYSLLYNASVVIPDLIICCIIIHLLPVDRIMVAMNNEQHA